MASSVQIADRLRENARRNGTLANVRAYYRTLAAERQRPTFLPGEIGAQFSLAKGQPETQTGPPVGS